MEAIHPGVWLLASAAAGAAGSWLARRYSLHRRMLDMPGERRSHTVATPRGGGVAIVAVVLVALLGLGLARPSCWVLLASIGAGLVAVAGVGWCDDHRPLSPWFRLAVHALAAVVLAVGMWQAGFTPLLAFATAGLALVLTNVWNFMDGIDGLAVSQAALVAAGLMLLVGQGTIVAWVGLALVGACLGFLPFNFPHARIFMGDVGSGALGYLLAALAGMSMRDSGPGQWWLLLLPLSAFLVDAALTLLSRIVRGERWWTPHTQHLYQGWSRHLGRHWPVTLGYGLWTAVTVLVMACVRGSSTTTIICVALMAVGLAAALWMCGRKVREAGSRR